VLHNNAGCSTAQDDTAVNAPLDEFWRAIIKATMPESDFSCPFIIGYGSLLGWTTSSNPSSSSSESGANRDFRWGIPRNPSPAPPMILFETPADAGGRHSR
jgi:hypothetical protein